jgi:hypothetical chaperone protein
MMKLGIDFGTTHTSAAWYDGQQLHFVPLDSHNANPALLRSMIYITREQQCHLGIAAVEHFLREDTGRPVVFQDKFVGTIENTVAQQYKGTLEPDGPITIIYDVTVEEEVGARGRLLQSIKTGLRSNSYRGTNIFGRYYTIQELIALILRHVRTQAEKSLGHEIRQATLGRPVHFSEDPVADQQAEERLRQAAALAGLDEVSFVPEPVAAAQFYLEQVRGPEIALVFDFGGGTLDFTLLRSAAGGDQTILATHGVSLGGDDLDSAIMRGSVAPHFGTTSSIDRNYDGRALPFPEDLAVLLNHWQTIPLLSRRQHLAVIQRAKKYGDACGQFAALECLVTQNHGFALFEQIEQSKRALSFAEQTTLAMQIERHALAIELTRPAFNMLIGEEMGKARQGVREVTAQAGVCASEIDTIVMTGGSSVIPAFQKMLAREFPNARLTQSNAFTSVVSGLAIAAASLCLAPRWR